MRIILVVLLALATSTVFANDPFDPFEPPSTGEVIAGQVADVLAALAKAENARKDYERYYYNLVGYYWYCDGSCPDHAMLEKELYTVLDMRDFLEGNKIIFNVPDYAPNHPLQRYNELPMPGTPLQCSGQHEQWAVCMKDIMKATPMSLLTPQQTYREYENAIPKCASQHRQFLSCRNLYQPRDLTPNFSPRNPIGQLTIRMSKGGTYQDLNKNGHTLRGYVHSNGRGFMLAAAREIIANRPTSIIRSLNTYINQAPNPEFKWKYADEPVFQKFAFHVYRDEYGLFDITELQDWLDALRNKVGYETLHREVSVFSSADAASGHARDRLLKAIIEEAHRSGRDTKDPVFASLQPRLTDEMLLGAKPISASLNVLQARGSWQSIAKELEKERGISVEHYTGDALYGKLFQKWHQEHPRTQDISLAGKIALFEKELGEQVVRRNVREILDRNERYPGANFSNRMLEESKKINTVMDLDGEYVDKSGAKLLLEQEQDGKVRFWRQEVQRDPVTGSEMSAQELPAHIRKATGNKAIRLRNKLIVEFSTDSWPPYVVYEINNKTVTGTWPDNPGVDTFVLKEKLVKELAFGAHNLSGNYRISGKDNDGVPYSGSCNIKLLREVPNRSRLYQFEYKIGKVTDRVVRDIRTEDTKVYLTYRTSQDRMVPKRVVGYALSQDGTLNGVQMKGWDVLKGTEQLIPIK